MLSIASLVFGIIFIYTGVPWLHSRMARVSLRRRARGQNALVLTFDDGPGSKMTAAVLSILAQSNAKATFFLLGRNIQGREAVVRQIAEYGHDICSHGYDHLHYWKVSPFRALSDMRRGWQAIDAAMETQRGTYTFRPPHGKLNIVCLLYLLIKRIPIVYWSVDTGDVWQVKPDRERLAMLLGQTGGMVCLAHDFDRSNESAGQLMLDSLRTVLSAAEKNRMQILTVSELLHAGK